MRRIGIVGLIVGLLVLAATACDAESVELSLVGAETIPTDESASYLATLYGGTPLMGYVYWYPFVDLDDDNWPDTNERLYKYRQYSGIDRLGQAEFFFWIDPEEYFEERDLDVPDKMTVGIRAELYWSDPIEPRVTRRDEVTTTITTP